jgi:hypothetical protein
MAFSTDRSFAKGRIIMKIDYTKFPKFTGRPNYRVNVQWAYLGETEKLYSLDLDPDFQRGHVWTPDQQREYIEFRLRGGMTGQEIYANHPGIGRGGSDIAVMVDGKQRWTAAKAFMNNEFPVLGGYYKSDIAHFPRLDPEVGFIFCVNDLKTRAEVLLWYLEMNTGGVIHTREELQRVRLMLDAEQGDR